MVGMIFCATFFDVGMFKAAVVAAAILLVTRCITFTQAYKSVDMQVLLVIIAAFGIGKAMEKTGAAAFIATQMVSLGGGSPWMALSMLYITTSILTEMVTNNAAALILWPIAYAMATQMGVSWTPFCLCHHDGCFRKLCHPHRISVQHDGVWSRRIPVQRFSENRNSHESHRLGDHEHFDPLMWPF